MRFVRVSSQSESFTPISHGSPLVSAGFSLKLNPVGTGCTANKYEFIFRQMEQNSIADNMPVVATGYVLFGPVEWKIGEAVDRRVRDQFNRIGTLNKNIHHVVSLIEKDAGFPPGSLFIAPVAKLGGDYRVDIGADLRIS